MNETDFPRILLLTSCTGEKRYKPTNPLAQSDFRLSVCDSSGTRKPRREEELAEFATPASNIYTGAQHRQAMEGVKALRQALGSQAKAV
ncbi:hypothetical protein FRE64_16695 (plasmid) [Euhalothece natronophila Z-M001]|uniref:Uncharacterized protein n=1 Tax=Euhalothece natronophila Z-M001 TaxID=522448 RepID=A0A5B8NSX7_9CHRO|nr:hypothetical protein [Euhalothece natronophila]QDZ41611.1 hypothetical protein FRE64_16695 [Euhalothece natronophila Z-M001]